MEVAPLASSRRDPLPLFLAGFFVVWAVRATLLFPFDAAIGQPLARWAYAAAWKLAVWLVPAVVYVAVGRPPSVGRALRLTTRPHALGTVAVAVLLGGAVAVLNAVVIGGAPPEALRASPAVYAVILGAASVSVLCEEVLFRGLVLGELARRRTFRTANVVQAVLFAAAHWPNWLWVRGVGAHLVTESAWVFALGLFFGWLVGRSGSLWPAVAAHLVMNALLGVLYAP